MSLSRSSPSTFRLKRSRKNYYGVNCSVLYEIGIGIGLSPLLTFAKDIHPFLPVKKDPAKPASLLLGHSSNEIGFRFRFTPATSRLALPPVIAQIPVPSLPPSLSPIYPPAPRIRPPTQRLMTNTSRMMINK